MTPSELSSSAPLTPAEIVTVRPGGALVIDAQGRILAANSEASRLFGDESSNLPKRTLDQILSERSPYTTLPSSLVYFPPGTPE